MADDQFTYVEVVESSTGKVIKRIYVGGKTDRAIDRVEDGLNINLNHDLYYSQVTTYESAQMLDPK